MAKAKRLSAIFFLISLALLVVAGFSVPSENWKDPAIILFFAYFSIALPVGTYMFYAICRAGQYWNENGLDDPL